MLKIFVGHDEREGVGLTAFLHSLYEHASTPLEVVVVTLKMAAELGVGTDGSNAFTKSRFLIPHWCNYQGKALWLDGADMMLRADIHDILGHLELHGKAVQVVKHEYTPAAERKYIGTNLECPNVPYPRKNWSSAMLFNNDHSACQRLTPEYVANATGQQLHRFEWIKLEEQIGDLPKEWNWLDEYGENYGAKLIHYTNGIPGFFHYRQAPHADEWKQYVRKAMRGMD